MWIVDSSGWIEHRVWQVLRGAGWGKTKEFLVSANGFARALF